MLSIELAQAHTRDLLDASATAYAFRDPAPVRGRHSGGDVRRRARALATRWRAR